MRVVLASTRRVEATRKHLETTDDWGRFIVQGLISAFFGAFLTVVFTQAISR